MLQYQLNEIKSSKRDDFTPRALEFQTAMSAILKKLQEVQTQKATAEKETLQLRRRLAESSKEVQGLKDDLDELKRRESSQEASNMVISFELSLKYCKILKVSEALRLSERIFSSSRLIFRLVGCSGTDVAD